MKKKNLLLILTLKVLQTTLPILLHVFPVTSNAQALSPGVISTSGGFHENASGMLSFTVGEMATVETLTSVAGILTQGFQQYWNLGTYVIGDPALPISFGIYPDVSDGHFNLVTESEMNAYVHVQILDVAGKEIFNSSFFHARGGTTESIHILNAPPGMYFIALRIQENKYSPIHHFIEKLQIIK
jgi:hypothetical protein